MTKCLFFVLPWIWLVDGWMLSTFSFFFWCKTAKCVYNKQYRNCQMWISLVVFGSKLLNEFYITYIFFQVWIRSLSRSGSGSRPGHPDLNLVLDPDLRLDGWMNERMNERLNEWMNEWIDECFIFPFHFSNSYSYMPVILFAGDPSNFPETFPRGSPCTVLNYT